MSIFDLSSLTPRQREITQEAIDATKFDYNLLLPKLQATKGKSQIPVRWEDLSRFGQAVEVRASGDHDHGLPHDHIEIDGDVAHVLMGEIEGRRAALGLAWYSGAISIEKTLEGNPAVAKEVFVAEGAHMVDFFFMTLDQKRAIFKAYHPGMSEAEIERHGHDWFDDEEGVGDPTVKHADYWSWVGESFMSGFLHAYASTLETPLEARQPWTHRTTPAIALQIREILTPTPVPPVEPVSPKDPASSPYFGTSSSRYFHDAHKGVRRQVTWETREEAIAAGRIPCKICKP